MDVLGIALQDYYAGNYTEDISTTSSLDENDVLPLPYLFRDFGQMPLIEQEALRLSRGRVLDIGCGAGNHLLYLQEKGVDAIGLDQSKGAIDICQKRGVKHTVCTDIRNYTGKRFDTLLLLMNGIGIAGKLSQLPKFLAHLKQLISVNGQILLDSSDIIYMFDEDQDGGYWVPGNTDYYGEVQFQMQYKNKKGPIFDWLYVDFNTLLTYAQKENFNCELIVEGKHFDYLARLTL